MPRLFTFALLAAPLLGGCSFVPLYSYSNQESSNPALEFPRPVENLYRVVSLRPPRPEHIAPGTGKASVQTVPWQVKAECRAAHATQTPLPDLKDCTDSNFIALAISGGGSRAAIFSAAAMFELQRYGLLEQVDLVSCVSGGCLTAAYYALSCDRPDDPASCPPTTNGAGRYAWSEERIYPLLERSLLWRWFGNWFWPDNILKFWFTHFDRTDIMAETLSNNLYDRSILDNNQFRFRDLNPARPNLAINATNVTPGTNGQFHFAFTPERFAQMHSDLARYPISNAVMASASFPGAFNYVTLRDFHAQRYTHLLDGGAYDNLGLIAVKTAMEADANPAPRRRVVIVIDAYPSPDEAMAKEAEPRGWTDYIVDSNFFVAYDTLLTSLRATQLEFARDLLKQHHGTLLHISWENLDKDPDPQLAWLGNRLNRIPTSLNISARHAERLRTAAKILVAKKLREVMCDSGHPEDAERLRALLSPTAPPIACHSGSPEQVP
jgi:predicted acylesterase/phospholipase RssA